MQHRKYSQMKGEKLYHIIAIIILTGFNIFLLYANAEHQNRITYLSIQQDNFKEKLEYKERSNMLNNTKIIHPEVELPSSGISLLVFFTDRGCPSCLTYEIPNLYKFYKGHSQFTQIYLLSNSDSYASYFEG